MKTKLPHSRRLWECRSGQKLGTAGPPKPEHSVPATAVGRNSVLYKPDLSLFPHTPTETEKDRDRIFTHTRMLLRQKKSQLLLFTAIVAVVAVQNNAVVVGAGAGPPQQELAEIRVTYRGNPDRY